MSDMIICTIEKSYYAFYLDQIQRIIESKVLTPVAKSSVLIDGILTYNSEPIEIINLRRALRLKEYQDIEQMMQKILIYENGDSVVGLLIDKVENIVNVNKSDFMETSKSDSKELIDITHVFEYQDNLICVINGLNVLELIEVEG